MIVSTQPRLSRAPNVRSALLAGILAISATLGVAATAGASTLDTGAHDSDDNNRGAIYTLTNAVSGNAVAVFARAENGTLASTGSVATGGLGTGGGLGSQSALVLSENGRWLFAVNAGSNQISVLEVQPKSPSGLALVATVSSGGIRPISITARKNVLYVLNAGASGNITGFSIGKNGALTPKAGSTRNLSNAGVGAAPGPAQIAFSPKGDALVVTEKATNMIDVYAVDKDDVAWGPTSFASSGVTPFGFAFGKRGSLIVSEAFGGAPNGSATSSYRLDDGVLTAVSASSPTHLTAACWVAVSDDGKFAYVTNAGSGAISAYRIGKDDALTLLNADGRAATTGATPIDMAFSRNGRFLYSLNAGARSLSAFAVQADGSLVALGDLGGLGAGMAGLAGR